MIAAPRRFAELKADEVRIRLLGDFAIIHAHMTLRTADGVQRQGRYTDNWQRRDSPLPLATRHTISSLSPENHASNPPRGAVIATKTRHRTLRAGLVLRGRRNSRGFLHWRLSNAG